MFNGFSGQKLKPQLKMAVSRFQIASNKKAALVKQQMRDIAKMLNEDPPKEEKAKIRAEALIREDNCIEAYEILQLECELLSERIKLLESCKECPADLVSCVSTIMWASDRVDIKELAMIRKQFRAKYGKDFEQNAINNVGGVLNERVVSKLSVQPPAAYLVQAYLERICEQHEVSWSPKVPVEASGMAEPMAAPVGYSVQVAGGTGLGAASTAAQMHINTQGGGDDAGGDQEVGKSQPPTPVVNATPYIPPAPGAQEDFAEVDIFVPPPPMAPVTAMPPSKDNDETDNGGGDDNQGGTAANSAGATKSMGTSYDDLAARFDQLKK